MSFYDEDYTTHSIIGSDILEIGRFKNLPIGLRPKYIATAQRIQEILAAMIRFANAGKKIPDAWIDELVTLNMEVV